MTNQHPDQGRLSFLDEVKQANPQQPGKWTRAHILKKYKLNPWNQQQVKIRDQFYSRLTSDRRKAFYQADQLLLFADGFYFLARSNAKDQHLVQRVVSRYVGRRNGYEKRALDILKVAAEKGWMTPEAVRVMRLELSHGGPARAVR